MMIRPAAAAAWLAGLAAGPLAVAGFFLPWTEGPGALASVDFSGYGLVAFSGRLTALDLGAVHIAALVAFRLAVLGVGVAALINALLAPAFRWHPAYAASGWAVVAAAPAVLALCLLLPGEPTAPGAGAGLILAGALAFAAAEAPRRGLRREARAHAVQQAG